MMPLEHNELTLKQLPIFNAILFSNIVPCVKYFSMKLVQYNEN